MLLTDQFKVMREPSELVVSVTDLLAVAPVLEELELELELDELELELELELEELGAPVLDELELDELELDELELGAPVLEELELEELELELDELELVLGVLLAVGLSK